MKLFKISILMVIFLAGASSCEKLEDINDNPNEPEEVSASVILTSAQRTSMNSMATESFLLANNISQMTAKTLRSEVGEYNWNAFPTLWENQYLALANLVDAERMAAEDGNPKMQGVSIVMQSWIFETLTLAYGDIPYTEAIEGLNGENYTPRYDDQRTIIMGQNDAILASDSGILDRLEKAVQLLGSDNGSISGDIINENNAMKWMKLANSLKLRLIMHVSSQIEMGDQFQDIVNEGIIISSNADNSVLEYLSNFPNNFPTFPLKQGDYDAVVMGERAYNRMDTLYGDPRFGVYARPDNINAVVNEGADPIYSGARNGAETGNCNKGGSRLGLRYYDYPGQPVGDVTANGIVMDYAETELLLAEAAEKGWISSDLETHYKNGIKASMNYYNVDYANWGWTGFTDFYNNSGAAYSGNVKDIWEQQWIASFFHGIEPFFQVRRWMYNKDFNFDEIPFLRVPCEDSNNGMLPVRFPYPGEESSLNSDSYQEAVNLLGSNSQNARMFVVEE